jgi:hypothetical protein
MPSRRLALAAALVLAAACSRGGDEAGKRRVFSREAPPPAAPHLDPARPRDALALDAGEVARAAGAFEWNAAVDWSVSREGENAARVHAAERHFLRQTTDGAFEVEADLDPGLGPGSETGKQIIYAGGMTYARARNAPFRERPTDRGRDARRFRDDSFRVAAAVLDLLGPNVRLEPAGDATVLGRTAHRYRISLGSGPTAPPLRAARAPDDDTARRFAFLNGKVPESADGEVELDARTGVPLRARIAAAFTVKDAPGVRAQVDLLAQMKALGDRIAAVVPPQNALPDVRKPPGVAGALEAAGLKKRGEAAAGGGEEEPEPE